MTESANLRASRSEGRWLVRVINSEAQSAGLLLMAAFLGLSLATAWPGFADAIHHWQFPLLNLSLAEFSADGLLVIFFFVAGLELRHELTVGMLNTFRAAAVPFFAAAGGMLFPVLIFNVLTPTEFGGAWGIPMATDLPIALALIAVFGKRLPLSFRAFILSLAIVDDVGSVLVIALQFGSDINLVGVGVAVGGVGAYIVLNRRRAHGAALALAGFVAWLGMLNAGVHPTVLGVALGLATISRGERFREALQPWSSGVCVPVFVFTALAIPVSVSAFDSAFSSALTISRLVGKPLGVFVGAALAIALLHPLVRLPWSQFLLAGVVATLGFSVSMLFAVLSIDEAQLLVRAQMGILVTLLAATVVTSVALRFFRPAAATT